MKGSVHVKMVAQFFAAFGDDNQSMVEIERGKETFSFTVSRQAIEAVARKKGLPYDDWCSVVSVITGYHDDL